AGTLQNITVTALAPGGGTDTGYLGTVQFSSSDAQPVLPANYTFTPTDHGTHTFSIRLKTAGSQSVTATDTPNPAILGTEENVTVQAAVATSFTVAGVPTQVNAGTPQSVTVTALDAFGNVATGYTGKVAFTSSDGQVVLPATTFMSPLSLGTAGYTVTLK